MGYLIYFTILAVIAIVSSEKSAAVSFINKCKLSDSKCLKDSANVALPIMAVGIPEYGIEPVDPHYVNVTDISSPNLKLILRNVTMTGFKNTVIQKMKFDKNNSQLLIKWLCNIQVDGLYEMDGNLIVLKLEGKGAVHGTIRGLEVTIHVDVTEKIGKDGATHWQLNHRDHSFVLKDKSDIVFENLFGGNEFLAKTAKEVIANSGNAIIYEAGPIVVLDFVTNAIANANILFDAVPKSELYME